MKIAETERLIIRYLTLADSEFWRDLLCTPTFIQYIGDRNVRTLEQSKAFLTDRVFPQYAEHGLNMYLVELVDSHTPIGAVGLLKREGIVDVDIGFALLPEYEGKGYAYEASKAVLDFGYQQKQLPKIIAFTSEDNLACQKLLIRLGLTHTKNIPWPVNEPDTKDSTMVFEPNEL